MVLEEKTIKSDKIYTGKIVSLRVDTVEIPEKGYSKREIIEHGGAVGIVAITDDNKIVLVKQFRKPIEDALVEIPAGKLEIGENPKGIPNNLMPYITKVAIGELEELSIFGDDYNTFDGTGVRDYIHVVDLAKGHIKALEKLNTNSGLVTYNLGTGKGYSVLDLVKAFSKASGKEIPYKMVGRRDGDIAICYADPSKANNELGWKAEKSIEEMCEDSWRWQENNSNCYSGQKN